MIQGKRAFARNASRAAAASRRRAGALPKTANRGAPRSCQPSAVPVATHASASAVASAAASPRPARAATSADSAAPGSRSAADIVAPRRSQAVASAHDAAAALGAALPEVPADTAGGVLKAKPLAAAPAGGGASGAAGPGIAGGAGLTPPFTHRRSTFSRAAMSLVAPPDRLAACSSAATASAGRSSSCRAHKCGRQRAKPRIAVCSRQAAVAWPRGATCLESSPAAKVRLVPLRAQRGARVGVAQRLPRLAQLQEGGAAVAARIDEERAVRARQQPGRRTARRTRRRACRWARARGRARRRP